MKLFVAIAVTAQLVFGGQPELERRLNAIHGNPPSRSELQRCIAGLGHRDPAVATAALERLVAWVLAFPALESSLQPAAPFLVRILLDGNSSAAAKVNSLRLLEAENFPLDRLTFEAVKRLVDSDDVRLRKSAISRLARAAEFRDEVAALFLAKLLDPQAKSFQTLILEAISSSAVAFSQPELVFVANQVRNGR